MKKIKYVVVALLLTFINIGVINAKCENDEIVENANNVTVNLNAVHPTTPTADMSYVNIENVPENYYIIAINNTNSTKAKYTEFESGKITFSTPNINYVYNYSIKIYSSDAECENELIKTINVDSLAYNPLSIGSECSELIKEDSENTFKGCDTYTNKIYTYEEFTEELDAYKSAQPEEVLLTISELFYKYYYFALIPVALFGVYYAVKLQVIKRRKNKDEE